MENTIRDYLQEMGIDYTNEQVKVAYTHAVENTSLSKMIAFWIINHYNPLTKDCLTSHITRWISTKETDSNGLKHLFIPKDIEIFIAEDNTFVIYNKE